MTFLSKIAFGNGAHQTTGIADFYPIFKYFDVNYRSLLIIIAVGKGIDDGLFKHGFRNFPVFFPRTSTLTFDVVAHIELAPQPLHGLAVLLPEVATKNFIVDDEAFVCALKSNATGDGLIQDFFGLLSEK